MKKVLIITMLLGVGYAQDIQHETHVDLSLDYQGYTTDWGGQKYYNFNIYYHNATFPIIGYKFVPMPGYTHNGNIPLEEIDDFHAQGGFTFDEGWNWAANDYDYIYAHSGYLPPGDGLLGGITIYNSINNDEPTGCLQIEYVYELMNGNMYYTEVNGISNLGSAGGNWGGENVPHGTLLHVCTDFPGQTTHNPDLFEDVTGYQCADCYGGQSVPPDECDCAGTGNVADCSGDCGGDNSSCSDCAGVPK